MLVAAVASLQNAEAQCQLDTIQANDTSGFLGFGWSIAADGDLALIGAAVASKVYAFQRQGDYWLEQQVLQFPMSYIGSELAISGDWAVLPSPGENPGHIFNAGAVHVLRRQAGAWVHTQTLVASDASKLDLFGISVDIDGSRMIVGAHPAFPSPGKVYVFELDPMSGGWSEQTKLMPSDPMSFASFGRACAVDGETLLVGAPGTAYSLNSSAYLFRRVDGVWTEIAKLTPPDGHPDDRFGFDLALEGDTAIVGAEGYHGHGAVFEYRQASGTWQPGTVLTPPRKGTRDFFGSSLSLVQQDLLVGADGDQDVADGMGAAYHFRRIQGSWVLAGKLLDVTGEEGEFAGGAVALAGDQALVGVASDDYPYQFAGSVVVYRLPEDGVPFCSCTGAAPCGNHDSFGGCRNSSGQGAILSACGTSSVASDDLQLWCRWLPLPEVAILFMGQQGPVVPFGDGLLCITGAPVIHRFPGSRALGLRGIHVGPGIVSYTHSTFPLSGQIEPGDEWGFQCWYRDSQSTCAAKHNLSNALRVTFRP